MPIDEREAASSEQPEEDERDLFPNSLLQMLDFHSSVQTADSHHSQEVLSGVTVVVNTTVESSSSVLANESLQSVLSTGVVVHE